MKKNYLNVFLLLFVFSCSPKNKYLTTDPSLPLNEKMTNGDKINLIGVSDRSGLQTAPFQEWYDKYYDNYQPNSNTIAKSKSKTKGIEVLAFMGTWCGDSKREVPRFYKVMDAIGVKEDNIKLVNVDRELERYKQSPTGEEKGLNIHRVPTFIFYKNGKEIGRIVESPMTSMETDVAQILNGIPPIGKYQVASRLHLELKAGGLEKIKSKMKPWANYVARYTYSSSELNSFGYTLLSTGRYEEAITIFKLNTLAYAHNANTFDSLGEAYMKIGKKGLAIENYKKVLEMKPDDKNAKEMLSKLEAGS